MRLSSRVKSLERRSGAAGPCQACGGKGGCGTAMWINGVEHARHGGCVRCGRYATVTRVILNYDTEQEAEEARRAWA